MIEKASRTGMSGRLNASLPVGLAIAFASLFGLSFVGAATAQPGNESPVFINEIHYDNDGGDQGESVEVAGPSGTDLGRYTVYFYNGNSSEVYETRVLSGEIPDQQNGYGTLSFSVADLQNGPRDGVALEGPDGVIQFLSYEGSLTATGGPASGETSTDIGVEEESDTAVGESLQLTGGPGETYGDFEWTVPAAQTFGSVNTGQTFGEASGEDPVETRIHDIQGARHTSPVENAEVANVPGVVTAFRDAGFFMQDSAEGADDSDATSEGIFVFTGSESNPEDTLGFEVGDSVLVGGTVEEFRPGGAEENLSETRISSSVDRVAEASASLGDIIPTTITLSQDEGDESRTPPTEVIDDDRETTRDIEVENDFQPNQDGIDFYESLEGMSVRVNDAVAIGPASDQGFGEIAVLPDGGAGASGTHTTRGGITITPSEPNDTTTTLGDDFNPELVIFDDEILVDGGENYTVPVTDTGDTYRTLSGIISYSFGNFKAQLTAPPERIEAAVRPEVTDEPGEDELSVATFSLRNLSPDQDPGDTTYEGAAAKIVENLLSPDVIGLTEVQDNDGDTNSEATSADRTAQSLIDAVEAAGGPTYRYVDIAPEDDADGGEPGGNIRVGFLYREDGDLEFVRRGDAGPNNATMIEADGDGGARLTLSPGRVDPQDEAFANSRKPLAGEFTYKGQTIIIVQNHFNSKGADDPLFGRFQPPALESEEQRERQSQVVNDFVDSALEADPEARVIVMGDLNDFEFSGPVQTLKGEDGALTNLVDGVAKAERYSFIFDGNSQVLDHMLVTDGLNDLAPTYDMVHASSDYVGEGSDHDPTVGRFAIPAADDGEDPPPACSNGQDDDGDGAADAEDPGCSGPNDGNETNPAPEPDPEPAPEPDPAPNPNACTITGTNGNDILRGTSRRDVICASGGNDQIRGFGGKDVIRGGAGNDRIFGGGGSDRIAGQQGNDALYGEQANDRLAGGPGNDLLRGGPGRDRLNGGRGRDFERQ